MQTKEVKGVATSIREDNEWTTIRYHQTDIVKFNEYHIILDAGGYKTYTTKVRMNQASNQFGLGYRVYQKGNQWYIELKGRTIEFKKFVRINRQAGLMESR